MSPPLNLEKDADRLRRRGEHYLQAQFGSRADEIDIDSVISDVFLRLSQLNEEPRNVTAFFLTCCKHAAISQLRLAYRKHSVALEAAISYHDLSADPTTCAENSELNKFVHAAMDRMRPNYRTTIVLRHFLGLTIPEISQYLGISLPAGKKLVQRSNRQLHKYLSAIEGIEEYVQA